MITKVTTINRDENNPDVVREVQTETYYGGTPNYEYDFYYKISEDSKLFFDNEGYCKMSIKTEKEIDYKQFHEFTMILSTVLEMLEKGLDDWEDIKNNEEELKEVATMMEWFTPISEADYLAVFPDKA